MKQTITNIINMAKKAVKKMAAKKSDKPKSSAKSKASPGKAAVQSEANKWADFVAEKKITTPFFQIAGGVRRTSDGKPYASPEHFFADGGAKDWSNVTKVD